jgi:hypothetical protein
MGLRHLGERGDQRRHEGFNRRAWLALVIDPLDVEHQDARLQDRQAIVVRAQPSVGVRSAERVRPLRGNRRVGRSGVDRACVDHACVRSACIKTARVWNVFDTETPTQRDDEGRDDYDSRLHRCEVAFSPASRQTTSPHLAGEVGGRARPTPSWFVAAQFSKTPRQRSRGLLAPTV